MKINISKMSKAIVLMALYNASKMQGNSFLGGDGSTMTEQEATERLKSQTSFDYLNGKVMKIDLSGDLLETWLYDRDNGDGAALRAIQKHYPDAVEMSEDEVKKESFKIQALGRANRNSQTTKVTEVVSEHLKGSATDTYKVHGKTGKLKTHKKKPAKPQTKIEYRKGFFTINGEVRKETKKQYAGRIVDTVGKLSEAGFKAKVDKSKK